MQEVFPLAAGALIGLLVLWIRGPRLRAIALVVLCLLFGTLASFISGELAVSAAFISVDTVLVFVGALAAIAAATWWRRRSSAIR